MILSTVVDYFFSSIFGHQGGIGATSVDSVGIPNRREKMGK